MKDAVISLPSGNPERQEETRRLHRYELRGVGDAIKMAPWGATDFIPPHRATIPGQDTAEKILEHRAETDHTRRVRRAATH